VDRSDVREEDSPNFYGIAPGKRVGLKYSHIVNITGIQKVGGKIIKITATVDHDVIDCSFRKLSPRPSYIGSRLKKP
jgi:hypothetical protein